MLQTVIKGGIVFTGGGALSVGGKTTKVVLDFFYGYISNITNICNYYQACKFTHVE